MTSAGASFIVACVMAAVLTPLVRRLGERHGLVEGNNVVLKMHDRAIVRIGGLAVAAAFFTPIVLVFLLGAGITAHFHLDIMRLLAFCGGALAILALGLWDDLHGATAKVKFSVQLAVALSVWFAGFRVEHLRLPFFGPVELGDFGLLVTLLWIIGITNAINLVDGLDGLAGGVAFFAAASHVVLGFLNGDALLTFFSAALAGAVLGFLPFNVPPARIFLGDSGSLFLGFTLALSSVYSATHKATTAVAVLGPILILGLPIMDTTLAVLRRTRQGRHIFDGDREHVHHRLVDLGLSHRRTVLLLYGLCAAFALAGLMTAASAHLGTALVLVSLLIVLVVFERRLRLLRPRATANGNGSAESVELLRELRLEARNARTVDQLWDVLCSHAERLDFYTMRLRRAGSDRVLREWVRPGLAGKPREGRHRFELGLGPGVEDGASPISVLAIEKRPLRRGAPQADELFAALLGEYLTPWPALGSAEPPTSTAAGNQPSRDS